MATFDQFIASLEQDFGEQGKGKPFEVFCKWFLENDPEWSERVDKVWLWDDYPNKWQRQDLGTDLVFRDNKGLIWAVQAKCYGEHITTTKGDMDSFLTDMGRTGVDRGLWMQTNRLVGTNAKHSLEGRDKDVLVLDLDRFRDAPLEYPASFDDLYKAKVKDKPTPDPHQIKAIADAASGLKLSDRGQMIMACGTGKTFTTLWIKEALEAHTTLVLLPSLSLLSQTMREWAWAGDSYFKILNVCSDKSVGKKTEDMDPADASFEVTSNVEKITEFLKQPKPKVVFCTYQSSELIAEAQLDDTVPDFDLAVADEAHRCAGKADAGFATILDADKIRASKRLFTTATPRYFGKAIKDEAKARDLAVVGMDDEAIFGPVIHKLTFGQAIEQELLTDYQVVIVGVDEPMVREWIENYEIVSTDPDNETDARTLAAKIGMLKAVKDYDLKRVISFHSRVAGAKQFSDELVDVANLIEPANRPEGTFLSDYVSGAMKAGDRKEKIDRLKVLEGYDRGILTNARCLAEGVDVPSLDGVAFIDPRGSQVEIIQAVGRAIRKVRGAKVQKKGTIVLPVFIEDGDDHEASIEASNFKPVWDVLKALRAHDADMASTLDQYRTNMAKNASQNRESISDKIIFDMPMSVDAEFSSALRTVLVEASTASWWFWFELLEQFKDAEGHCMVPQLYIIKGKFKLGNWVINQRMAKSLLDQEKIEILNSIGFVWNVLEHNWEQGLHHLTELRDRTRNLHVPNNYQTEDGFKLGLWAANIKTRKNKLSPEKIEILDNLGFCWNKKDYSWNEGLENLHQFKRKMGNCLVSAKYVTENGFKLGVWVNSQRRREKRLTPGQIERLNQLDFIWDSLSLQWESGLHELKHFKQLQGHCRVPDNFKMDNGFSLGNWVKVQRRNKSTLPQDRLKQLNMVGFVWNPFDEKWEKGFKQFKLFVDCEGHCLVGDKYIDTDGYPLGNWVGTQRQTKKKMSISKVERLDALGFIWNALEHRWETGLTYLKKFKELEGHCQVKKAHETYDGFQLGSWVRTQRKFKDRLPVNRIKKLNAVGFIWNTSKDKN